MSEILTASTLQDLVPVHQLNSHLQTRLAASGVVGAVQSGRKLTASQEYPWLDYLLAGKVCLIKGKEKEIIEAGSMRACQPLFSADRLWDQAVFLSDGELLRLDRQLYESLSGVPSSLHRSLDAIELNEPEALLLGQFYKACKAGTLALPSLPKVARAIQEALQDPMINSAQIARIVQMDQAVTGGLIRLANSVLFRGNKPIPNLRDAIIRIGLNATRSAVVSMAMQQLFKTRSPLMKHHMKAVWNRSVHVSALSFVIARHSKGFNPEQALLAGLLHDVGVIPILDYVSRHQDQIEDNQLDAMILKLKIMVGELVVGYWGFGQEMVQVVRDSGNWYRDTGEQPDYCDLVLIARLYRMKQSESRGPVPRYDDVPAYFKLGLNLSETGGENDMLEEASEELNAVMAMLKGSSA